MNPLPPKMKVPGWKRFAMQQHDIQSFAPVRTYEGVLIPEGKLILGRWKDPHPLMPARTSVSSLLASPLYWALSGSISVFSLPS